MNSNKGTPLSKWKSTFELPDNAITLRIARCMANPGPGSCPNDFYSLCHITINELTTFCLWAGLQQRSTYCCRETSRNEIPKHAHLFFKDSVGVGMCLGGDIVSWVILEWVIQHLKGETKRWRMQHRIRLNKIHAIFFRTHSTKCKNIGFVHHVKSVTSEI